MAPELQEDLLGTKVKKVLLIRSISEFLNPVLQEMSRHQNCKRMGWYNSYQCEFISVYEFASAWHHEMSRHQNCKRCPSTSLYELL